MQSLHYPIKGEGITEAIRRGQGHGAHNLHHTEVGQAVGSEGTKGTGGRSTTQGGSTEGPIGALAR